MIVKELKNRLADLPDDMKVLIYIDEIEEYGDITKIESIDNQDDMPYSKADCPQIDKEIILISGYPA